MITSLTPSPQSAVITEEMVQEGFMGGTPTPRPGRRVPSPSQNASLRPRFCQARPAVCRRFRTLIVFAFPLGLSGRSHYLRRPVLRTP